MRGNACDLTFTYYCSLWGFWREVITSSLLQSVTWCVFCGCCHFVSSSELSRSLSYRRTSFYCTSQLLRFSQIEGLWQPCIQQVYWHHFSNSICSLHVSVSHVSNSHTISNIFIIIFAMMIFDLWSLMLLKKVTTHWRLRWWLAVFSNDVFLN